MLRTTRSVRFALPVVLILATISGAQTKIQAPNNRYSPEQDVELGREAAAEVAKELPLLGDRRIEDYVETIGDVLVASIPAEFRHSQFRYTFDVINQKDINAFALPGGPMFLNRGMIEAARSEGEVAGVMAHEVSHVALRHGTAQATKGRNFQIGSVFGQILGAIVGGTAGSVISQGTQLSLGTYFLKYGREYETQADLLGAQILARAGYDPRDMADMFKTIEAQGGSRGPEWLSSHPNPGNRYEAINREARMLRVQGRADTGDFSAIQTRLADMAPAYTAEEIARGQASSGPRTASTSVRSAVRVAPPSADLRQSRPFPFLRLSLPANWAEVAGSDTGATYAPDGGFALSGGALEGFSHGLQVGIATRGTGDLAQDTDRLIASFARSNPSLRRRGGYARERIDGRAGLRATLSNESTLTGRPETVWLATTLLRDGQLAYFVGVAPENEAPSYEAVFRRIRQSVSLYER
jgi:hypothetical protein